MRCPICLFRFAVCAPVVGSLCVSGVACRCNVSVETSPMTCWLPVPRCRPFASTSSADSFRMSLTRSFLLFAPFESALPAIMSVSQTSSIASGRLCTSMWCLLTSSCTSQVAVSPVTLALPWRKTCRAFALSCILSLDSPRIARSVLFSLDMVTFFVVMVLHFVVLLSVVYGFCIC